MRTQSTVCLGFAALVVLPLVTALSAAGPERAAKPDVPTFAKDVAPILYKNCTTCHRPGEIAPMSLLTYADARPYAKAIRDEVGEGHMPPWHADAPAGTFENERKLSDEDRKTLLAWATGGAPKGNLKELPPAPKYPEGWTIGKPDLVLQMQEDYKIPANGTVNYEYFYIPTNFTEAKYVQAVEVRPGNRKVVHHVLVQYLAKPDMTRTPVLKFNAEWQRLPRPVLGDREPRREQGVPSRLLATYAPGTNPQVFRPGTALRLEPGGVLELQMHYTPNGKPTTDRTKVGFIFSKDPAPREVRPSAFFNTTFTLPAGSSDTSVPGEVEFQQDTIVYGIFPHTHLRGKAWEYKLVLPDGTSKTILSVPHYDFNWQTYYLFKEPLQVPKGAKIVSTAWYDNSSGNKDNPNSKADVKWGDQTWEEMQYTGLLFSPVAQPKPVTDTRPGGGAAVTSLLLLLILIGAARPAAHDPITTKITFAREIRAILSARCTVCHSRGGSAPMPLTTYDEVRPWARAIKEQVLARRMPEWHAARGFGAFKNDPTLTPIEMAMVASWVDGGLPFSTASARVPSTSSPEAGSPSPSLAASAFRRKIGLPAVPVAAGANEGSARVDARWVAGWSFEPGDPLITAASFSLPDGTVVGTWVAGDEPVMLPPNSAIRITSPLRVGVQRRPPADYEQPYKARASVLRLVTQTEPPLRRAWTEQVRCGAPRTGRPADLVAIRPLLADEAGARIWLERAGAPRTIVGWFRGFDSRFPRTYWLSRPADLSIDARLLADAPCDLLLTLVSHR